MINKGNIKDADVNDALHYFIALIFILESNTVYMSVPQLAGYLNFSFYILLACAVVCSLLISGKLAPGRRPSYGLVICTLILIYLSLFSAVNGYNVGGTLKLSIIAFVTGIYYFESNTSGKIPQLLKALAQEYSALNSTCHDSGSYKKPLEHGSGLAEGQSALPSYSGTGHAILDLID